MNHNMKAATREVKTSCEKTDHAILVDPYFHDGPALSRLLCFSRAKSSGRRCRIFSAVPLTVIAGMYSSNREVLIQVRPVQAKRLNLDVGQQALRSSFKPRIALDWETEIQAAGHRNINAAFAVKRLLRCIN